MSSLFPFFFGHRVTTVSTQRSSLSLWSPRYFFGAGNTVIARRLIPLIHSNSLTNLWYCTCARSGMQLSLLSQFLFISFARPASPYSEEHVCICTHISDCIETVYGLPLLPNNTAAKRSYTNRSGAKCRLDIYHWGAGVGR